MSDDQDLTAIAPRSLEPAQVVQIVRGPNAAAWLDGLGFAERAIVAEVLKRALVESELAGTYTTPDLMSGFQRLSGTENELDHAVLGEAAVRREQGTLTPAGTAVVWARLLRTQESLSEAEVRTWLNDDMVRALAAKSTQWSRFSAIVLGDWARADAVTTTEDALAHQLIARHPKESAAVLAQAMREQPASAERLADRIEHGSPKTISTLAAAIVDDASIPAGLRVALAGRSTEDVRDRARLMVARELGVSDEALAKLAPDQDDEPTYEPEREDGATPAAMRLAWTAVGVVILITGVVQVGLRWSFFLAMVAFVIAFFIGREDKPEL